MLFLDPLFKRKIRISIQISWLQICINFTNLFTSRVCDFYQHDKTGALLIEYIYELQSRALVEQSHIPSDADQPSLPPTPAPKTEQSISWHCTGAMLQQIRLQSFYLVHCVQARLDREHPYKINNRRCLIFSNQIISDLFLNIWYLINY